VREASDNSQNSGKKKPRFELPKPKSFHITEPAYERGLWCFWLASDDDVLQFVSNLNCILQPSFGSPFGKRLRGRVLFAINPRYDHEETWLWLHEILESESARVELNEDWESAIHEAHSSKGIS
jgi:hypothetical protein